MLTFSNILRKVILATLSGFMLAFTFIYEPIAWETQLAHSQRFLRLAQPSIASAYTLDNPQRLEYDLLRLVDKTHSLGTYVPKDLITVRGFSGHLLRVETEQALQDLVAAARINGVKVYIRSAYRSYSTQAVLFQDYSGSYGVASAETFSARPGHSEHQLGTTIDFGTFTNADFNGSFDQTSLGQWLITHAYEFGFVMSYADGAEAITGYIYEPWHWRYVGKDAAQEVKNRGITLQEYLESRE